VFQLLHITVVQCPCSAVSQNLYVSSLFTPLTMFELYDSWRFYVCTWIIYRCTF